ncbi:MAG: response regulator [Proteobacteria bacterium]|nr:response regulator [Cystobacterineae bacterium]MCL2313815.1 response regulator [Pseudomonadota bacterium]
MGSLFPKGEEALFFREKVGRGVLFLWAFWGVFMSIRVLFVESDIVLVELLSPWLKQRGMEVVARVDSREAALEACEKHEPHLALVALKALPFSALELVQQLRAKYPSMQVLVSSFWASWEELKEAKCWGAQAGFSRPPSFEEFQHALKACHFETP